jgi:hypothetical protein
MRLLWALAALLAASIAGGRARADDYLQLLSCVRTGNESCLESVGLRLSAALKNPRAKSLMMARFALVDWASGSRIEGDTRLLRAWSHLAEVPNDGCLPRVDATFAFEELTALFGHTLASKLILRNLVNEAARWPKDKSGQCSRPAGEKHFLVRVAERQKQLGDESGLKNTLDLALAARPRLRDRSCARGIASCRQRARGRRRPDL